MNARLAGAPEICFGKAAEPAAFDDAVLIERIVGAYRCAIRTPLGDPDSMWLKGQLLDIKRDVHEALISSDIETICRMLRDPGSTDLLHGFEDLSRTFQKDRLPAINLHAFASSQYLVLMRLCEAVGVRRIRHDYQPEQPLLGIEDALVRLDRVFGYHVDFPNPFPDEAGVVTSRGVVTYRAPNAVYQAWRIRQLVGKSKSPRVLEIGGGLGRTAYYARQFGITDYTIVDIPMSLVAQANFLGRTVGPQYLRLHGEAKSSAGCIKLIPPAEFFAAGRQYDLALNVDSLTEMARDTAQAYVNAIYEDVITFLSINHEGLPFTVAELMPDGFDQRVPYWMRSGYVEELGSRKRPRFSDYIPWAPARRLWRRRGRWFARK